MMSYLSNCFFLYFSRFSSSEWRLPFGWSYLELEESKFSIILNSGFDCLSQVSLSFISFNLASLNLLSNYSSIYFYWLSTSTLSLIVAQILVQNLIHNITWEMIPILNVGNRNTSLGFLLLAFPPLLSVINYPFLISSHHSRVNHPSRVTVICHHSKKIHKIIIFYGQISIHF